MAAGGVEAVGHSRMVPLQGGGFGLGGLRVPGASDEQNLRLSNTDWDVVSPDYFSTIGLPIVEGRAFTPDDRAGQPPVAIINESLATLAFPGESAVGREIWQTEDPSDPSTWKWTAADKLFLRLLEEAHKRRMRIIIDGVFNHTGMTFWALDDVRRHGAKSKYADWYTITRFDDPTTEDPPATAQLTAHITVAE